MRPGTNLIWTSHHLSIQQTVIETTIILNASQRKNDERVFGKTETETNTNEKTTSNMLLFYWLFCRKPFFNVSSHPFKTQSNLCTYFDLYILKQSGFKSLISLINCTNHKRELASLIDRCKFVNWDGARSKVSLRRIRRCFQAGNPWRQRGCSGLLFLWMEKVSFWRRKGTHRSRDQEGFVKWWAMQHVRTLCLIKRKAIHSY